MGSDAKPLSGVRVCYVSTGEFSGATRSLKQAKTLAEAGADVVFAGYKQFVPESIASSPYSVIAIGPPAPPQMRSSTSRSPLIRALLNRTVNRLAYAVAAANHRRESRRIDDLPFFVAAKHQRLIEAVQATAPQVIQSIDLSALPCCAQAAGGLGCALVYDSHELWYGFVRNPDYGLPPALADQLLAAERDLIGECDLVLTVSEPMSDRLVERYGIAKPLTIYNAPPAKVESARPASQPVRLVFHGGLSADRNIEGLIDAMAVLGDRATLDIHGSGRTISQESLQARIDALGLHDTVRLHGRFDYERVIDVIAGYDMGVMAAKVSEENMQIALPNKLFDCLCAGLAVAMNDSEGMRSILADAAFGVLLDPSSPETIAAGLEPLVADPERVTRMKAAALEAAPQYWWPEQGRKLVEAIRAIVASN